MTEWRDYLLNEEYHTMEGLSSSTIKELAKSSAHYLAMSNDTTSAMEFGTLIHTAVLEPHLFDMNTVKPCDARLKEGSAAWLKKQEAVQNQVKHIVDAVHGDANAMAILSQPSHIELSGFFDIDGVPCKIRPDQISEDFSSFSDLKTTSATDIDGCVSAILSYQYDVSYAFYRLGIEIITGVSPDFHWIFVSKKAPYDVFVIRPSEEMYEQGLITIEIAIENYKKLKKNSDIPIKRDYGVTEVSYPAYYKRKER